jgi:hypothetical protein
MTRGPENQMWDRTSEPRSLLATSAGLGPIRSCIWRAAAPKPSARTRVTDISCARCLTVTSLCCGLGLGAAATTSRIERSHARITARSG